MTKRECVAVFAALCMMGLLAGQLRAQPRPQPDQAAIQAEAQQLLAQIQSAETTENDRAIACKRLAAIGTPEAIPTLVKMLDDEKWAHYARFSLEAMPFAQVDDALIAAMGKLQGRRKVGVINSLGIRRCGKATDALTSLTGDADPEVASSAMAALGRIASPAAAKTLAALVAKVPGELKAPAADACLVCGEQLGRAKKFDEATAMFDAVRKADVPKHFKIAAVRGAILAGPGNLALLAEQLRSADNDGFEIGLRCSRELKAAEVTGVLVAALSKLPAPRQALVVLALGDRGDRSALPAVLKAAASESADVAAAAVKVLSRMGDASAVDVLFAAAKGSGEVAEAALQAMVDLRGPGVDEKLVAILAEGDKSRRPMVIAVVGQRRIAAAAPALLKLLASDDQPTRLLAIEALGETIGLKDLDALVARLVKPASDEEAAAVQGALKAAVVRMPDAEACVAKLAAPLPGAPAATKGVLFDLMSAVGGPKALQIVAAAARSNDADVQDEATRALGEWMSADAGPVLLELATSDLAEKFRVRAIRGHIRIARQLDMPVEQRMAMVRQGLATAWRDAERKLLIEVLGRNPSPASLEMAVSLLGTPAVKEDAASVAVTMAEKLIKDDPKAVAEALPKVAEATANADLAKRAKQLANQAKKKVGG